MHRLIFKEIVHALDKGWSVPQTSFHTSGKGELPSWFDVTGLATASIAAAGTEIQGLIEPRRVDEEPDLICVDRRLASLWFGWSLYPLGWTLPPAWDPIAGDYAAADGWIRLHTNAPAHKTAALKVLAAGADRSKVEKVIADLPAEELETEIVNAGGCAAKMHSLEQWRQHAQGRAVASESLVSWSRHQQAPPDRHIEINPDRPLQGLKVLDLTRVLAGPVATRFLAAYGATVLRIDPPGWNEPGVIPEVTPGKYCAELDLKIQNQIATFEGLVRDADILVHGYRPGALEGLGFDKDRLQLLSPGLINISLCAYGWTGPWSGRRGFDSLVQMSTGIAHEGAKLSQASQPVPLPVQALDQATGYLAAAAAVRAYRARLHGGIVLAAQVSLARTANLLINTVGTNPTGEFAQAADEDMVQKLEQTDWGPAHRITFPVTSGRAQGYFSTPARGLRTSAAKWPV